jgi:integrase/recombinase XerD
MSLRVINKERVNRYANKRLGQIKSATAVQGGKEAINQEIMTLSHFIRWTGTTPQKFDRYRLTETVIDVPTQEEILALINAMEPFWKVFYSCMYYTGARSDEIKRLKRGDVNLARRYIKVYGKGSKQRLVAVNNTLLDILNKYLETVKIKDDGLFFPSPRGGEKLVSINKAIHRAKKKTKLAKRVYPHMFRHSFGTHLVLKGGNMRILQELMGHEDIRTTMKYVNIAFGDQYIDEVNKLG